MKLKTEWGKNKYLISLCVLVAILILLIAYSLFVPKTYESRADCIIDLMEGQADAMGGVVSKRCREMGYYR